MDERSDRLQEWVTRAELLLAGSPEGELPLGVREALLGSFGPEVSGSSPLTHQGHRRRLLLAIASARKTLHFWHSQPGDLPERILATAERALRETLDSAVLAAARERFSHEIERCSEAGVDVRETRVGRVALYAVARVVDDFAVDPAEVDLTLTDADLDGYGWDGHYMASVVAANGHPGQPGSDPEKRREFWHWWLTEAVPRAYREGTLSGEASP